jgi:hypothetical protein
MDPYTGDYPTTKIYTPMWKEFDSKQKAQKFIDDAPVEIRNVMKLEELQEPK